MINIKKSSYLELPDSFYSKATIIQPQNAKDILFNHALASELKLTPDWQEDAHEPIALAYAGHQYGRYVPQLGDGRAAILGEVTGKNGNTIDLQLKGSGPTKFSRGGDGYATISSTLREYIISEAMHALGVPTTRSLAVTMGTDHIMREAPHPRGVLTRTASSFIRIGSFEYFAAKKDYASIKKLADHTIQRNFPETQNAPNKYQALLEAVCTKQAILIAKWMGIGFIHGVMNTDNTALSGETLDYGPCAFMDEYKSDRVFSSIDRYNRYAYNMQPDIMLWNLTSFANCIAFLLAESSPAQETIVIGSLENFLNCFQEHYFTNMLAKIGLTDHQHKSLIESLLKIMEASSTDFTLTFSYLAEAALGNTTQLLSLFKNQDEIKAWITKWQKTLAESPNSGSLMQTHNPQIIPRNHVMERVLQQYTATKDITEIKELLSFLQQPFKPAPEKYTRPPLAHEKICQTFCGT